MRLAARRAVGVVTRGGCAVRRIVPHGGTLGLDGHATRHGHAGVQQTSLEGSGVVLHLGLARNVEQVNAHENDDETAQQRDGVDGVGGVEALEQDCRGDNRRGREEDVVDRVDDVGRERVERLVKVVLPSAVALTLMLTICTRMQPTTTTPNT